MKNGNQNTSQIVYLKNKDIDKIKWDACITNASNGLVYAYSFYLDTMSMHWDALILDDYKAVMPLTWKSKFSIHYLYQPFFAASLGVFGNQLSLKIVRSFLENIPAKFKYWDIYLNHKNIFQLKDFPFYERTNYVLNLAESYEKLSSAFSKSHLRNIARATQSGCYSEKNIGVEEVIALAKQQSKKFSPVTDDDYERFLKLYKQLYKKNKAITYGVFSKQKQLLASCVYFFSHNRAYYILVGNHPNGRTLGASHFLINEFIKDNAGKDLLLDFEGSEIRNLAYFYSSFGAKEEKYAAIKLNKLPAILKLLKK